MEKIIIAPITEMVASLLTHNFDAQTSAKLQQDPHGYIAAQADFDIPNDIDIAVVHNDAKTVNLVLPYYDVLNENPPAIIEDADMADASGGWAAGLSAMLKESGQSLEHSGPLYFGRSYTVHHHASGDIYQSGPGFWASVVARQASLDDGSRPAPAIAPPSVSPPPPSGGGGK